VTGTEHEFPDIIEGARKLATGAGGYVVEESSTSIALRIPNERLDSVLASLTTLGKVTRKNVTARDVTAEYTDLEIRLDNARALEGRLKEILKQASTVAETLDVERELARVTLELDKLEGQKRLMNSQITFATLRLTLSGRIRKGPLGWAFYGLYRGVKWLFVWS
jgi:hypothetical protein